MNNYETKGKMSNLDKEIIAMRKYTEKRRKEKYRVKRTLFEKLFMLPMPNEHVSLSCIPKVF